MACDPPFLCPPMDGHGLTGRRIQRKYALIVAESTAPLGKAECIAWERTSLFFVGRAAAPESGQAGKSSKSSAAAETFQAVSKQGGPVGGHNANKRVCASL